MCSELSSLSGTESTQADGDVIANIRTHSSGRCKRLLDPCPCAMMLCVGQEVGLQSYLTNDWYLTFECSNCNHFLNLPCLLKSDVMSHPSSPSKLIEKQVENQELLIPDLQVSGMHDRLSGTVS